MWTWTKKRIRQWPALLTFVLTIVVLLGVLPHMYVVWLILKLVTIGRPDSVIQKGEDFVFGTFQRLVLFFFEHVTGAQVILYGDAEDVLRRKERVLYLSNHQSALDWVVVDMLAARAKSLSQIRYVLKDSIKYIPYFGHSLNSHGCVYVKRKQLNMDKMKATLKYLLNPGINSWIVLFPEGTRYNLALSDRSHLIGRSRQDSANLGLQPLNHLLVPRSRGLWLMIAELGKTFDAFYDVTVIYEGTKNSKTGSRQTAPTLFEFVMLSRPKIHLHVRRIDMCDVPISNEKSIQDWLYELFLQKDRLLDSYYGHAESKENSHRVFGCPGRMSYLAKWETVPTECPRAQMLLAVSQAC